MCLSDFAPLTKILNFVTGNFSCRSAAMGKNSSVIIVLGSNSNMILSKINPSSKTPAIINELLIVEFSYHLFGYSVIYKGISPA